MITREDFESYLMRLDVEIDEIDDDMWVIRPGEDGTAIVVSYSPPLVLLRLKVMELPKMDDTKCATLYRRMLEMNASDIVHGSYGIEGNNIVISDALQLEDLDFSELRSSYESMVLAAASHMPVLAELVPVAHEG